MSAKKSIAEKFLARVAVGDGCWEWAGEHTQCNTKTVRAWKAARKKEAAT